jgi:hypothetical protein
MRTETINVYEFNELSDRAKARALDDARGYHVDDEWWTAVYDDAERIGVKLMYFDAGRRWQISLELLEDVGEIVRRIIDNHGPVCATYKLAQLYYLKKHKGHGFDLPEFEKEIGQEYLVMLRDEHEYLTSDEAITEALENGDYEFTEDGKVHRG